LLDRRPLVDLPTVIKFPQFETTQKNVNNIFESLNSVPWYLDEKSVPKFLLMASVFDRSSPIVQHVDGVAASQLAEIQSFRTRQ